MPGQCTFLSCISEQLRLRRSLGTGNAFGKPVRETYSRCHLQGLGFPGRTRPCSAAKQSESHNRHPSSLGCCNNRVAAQMTRMQKSDDSLQHSCLHMKILWKIFASCRCAFAGVSSLLLASFIYMRGLMIIINTFNVGIELYDCKCHLAS